MTWRDSDIVMTEPSSPRLVLHLSALWSAIALLLIVLAFLTFRTVDTVAQAAGGDAERQAATLIATNRLWLQSLFITVIAATVALGLAWSWFLIRRTQALTLSLEQERKMRERADVLACAVEQTQDAVIIADRQGVIEYVNPGFTNMTGYTAEEAIGRTPGALLKSGRQDNAFYHMVWDTILAGNTWQGTLTNRKKSGDFYIADETISPIRAADGVITHFVAVQRDLTEQRTCEHRLQQAEKLEAIGQLAGGIAHDFNNLLTPILGHAELLLDATPSDDRTTRHIAEIQRAARQAATVTRQLLTFSRRGDTVRQALDINRILTELISLLDHTIGEHIELRLIPGQSIGTVNGDAAHLETAVLNLVLNARDAMPNGGQLTLRTDTVTVGRNGIEAPAGTLPGSYVRLRVSDTGHGMPPDVQARIFEPFFTTKDGHKGTGLGLMIVDRVVKTMSGFLTMTSEPSKGTTFDLYFPRADHENAPAGEPSPETTPTCFGEETLLLVEDDELIRNLASLTLRRLGYRVLEAEDGEAALQLADNHDAAIHLLVTDIMLPKMNGRQLGLTLLQRRPNVKVLYVSGFADSTLTRYAGPLDPIAYLPKPYTPSSLARRIRALLDQP